MNTYKTLLEEAVSNVSADDPQETIIWSARLLLQVLLTEAGSRSTLEDFLDAVVKIAIKEDPEGLEWLVRESLEVLETEFEGGAERFAELLERTLLIYELEEATGPDAPEDD